MKTQRYSIYAGIILSLGLCIDQKISNAQAKGNVPALKKITIEEQPIDQVVKYGESVQFKIKAATKSGGGPIGYQWTHNFIPMEGETKPTLSLGKVSRSDLGAYSCILSTQHDNQHDQPEFKASELVSLIGYSISGDKVVLEGFPLPMCEEAPALFQGDKGSIQKAAVSPIYDRSSDSALIYASGGRSGSRYGMSPVSAPLYFISGGGTNQIIIGHVPPVGGAGAGSGNCPPPYKCYFNFRKSAAPFGWLPVAGAATGKAKHLQSPQTVVKWFIGTQSSGCGTGEVNITFGSPNDVYRFTVYCPSSSFSTCLTGVQQLELTNFQP